MVRLMHPEPSFLLSGFVLFTNALVRIVVALGDRCTDADLVQTPYTDHTSAFNFYNEWQSDRFLNLTSNVELADGNRWRNIPCGKVGQDLKPIVHGKIAPALSIPWIAKIRTAQTLCSGSLISDRWVVTVAHCVIRHAKDPAGVTVSLGRVKSTGKNTADTFKHTIPASEVVPHPKFKNMLQDDVALIKLSRPVKFSNRIYPICLSQPYDLIWPSMLHLTCYAAGYGISANKDKAPSGKLNYYKVEIKSTAECKLKWGWKFHARNLCGAPPRGSGSVCHGDSGGPLMCVLPGLGKRRRYYLLGTIGFALMKPCRSYWSPNVFLRFPYYLGWLRYEVEKRNNSIPYYWDIPFKERFNVP